MTTIQIILGALLVSGLTPFGVNPAQGDGRAGQELPMLKDYAPKYNVALIDYTDSITEEEVINMCARSHISCHGPSSSDLGTCFYGVDSKSQIARAKRLVHRLVQTRRFRIGEAPDFEILEPDLRFTVVAGIGLTWQELMERMPPAIRRAMSSENVRMLLHDLPDAVAIEYAVRPYDGAKGKMVGYDLVLRGRSWQPKLEERKLFFTVSGLGFDPSPRNSGLDAPISVGWSVGELKK